MADLIFYIFGFCALAGAVTTAFTRNLVYSAFGLLFTFFGVAGLYVMASADFLAVTQLLVYVGGILILLIFGIMLTTRISSVNVTFSGAGASKGVVGLLSLGLLIILCVAYFGNGSTRTVKGKDGKSATVSTWASTKSSPWSQTQYNKDINEQVLSVKHGAPQEAKTGEGSQGTAMEIGRLMLTDWLLPFEIVSVVILVALIGAVMIARKEPTPAEELMAEVRG
jgi:NADH:ubiquinone oxidoreductase subunit 6 (subunit J)